MERQIAEQGHKKKSVSEIKPQKQNPMKEVKRETEEKKTEVKEEKKDVEVKTGTKQETKEPKKEEKPEKKDEKIEEKQIKESKKEEKRIKKELAYIYGKDLPLSYKTSGAVCRFIKNKNPSEAIKELEQVIRMKRAIPFRGEVPHRKGLKKGYARGRYPIKTSEYFIKLLKSLISNAKTNLLDTEKIRIVIVKADKASSPIRGTRMAYGRKRFKRSNIYIEVKEVDIKHHKDKRLNEKKEKTNESKGAMNENAQSKDK
jgi:large subunit ribosomal protein L22